MKTEKLKFRINLSLASGKFRYNNLMHIAVLYFVFALFFYFTLASIIHDKTFKHKEGVIYKDTLTDIAKYSQYLLPLLIGIILFREYRSVFLSVLTVLLFFLISIFAAVGASAGVYCDVWGTGGYRMATFYWGAIAILIAETIIGIGRLLLKQEKSHLKIKLINIIVIVVPTLVMMVSGLVTATSCT